MFYRIGLHRKSGVPNQGLSDYFTFIPSHLVLPAHQIWRKTFVVTPAHVDLHHATYVYILMSFLIIILSTFQCEPRLSLFLVRFLAQQKSRRHVEPET